MVGECFDVSDERTCVHLQGDMDAAVQCYTDQPSVDSLEKRPKHNILHIHIVTVFLLLHHLAYLIHEAESFLRSYTEPNQSRSYPTSHSLKIHLNITLLPMPGSLKWSLSFIFPHQNPACISPLRHACYMPCPSHSTRFYYPNNIPHHHVPLMFYTFSLITSFREYFNLRTSQFIVMFFSDLYVHVLLFIICISPHISKISSLYHYSDYTVLLCYPSHFL